MICFIFLLLSLETKDHPVFKNNIMLDMTLLKSYDEIDCHINKIRWLPGKGIVIFSFRDKVIRLYEPSSSSLTTLASLGPGPREIQSLLVSGFVFDDHIIFKDMSNKMKAFRPGEVHRVINTSFWAVDDCVKVSGHAICNNTSFSPAPLNIPETSLLIFEIEEDGSWTGLSGFLEDDVVGDPRDDIKFAMYTSILAAAKSDRFYRFPLFLHPNIQLLDINGKVHKEIPIPHPAAQRLPTSPKVRRDYRLEHRSRPLPITDIVSDKAGYLYSLVSNAPGKKDLSCRIIAKQNTLGEIVQSYRIETPIKKLVVSPDGSALYGVDDDNNLYALIAK